MKTVLSVVGARPQFVKLAPLSRELREPAYRDELTHTIVHTGQHYDTRMSDIFFDELNIPRPDIDLQIGSGTHGQQTARMLEALEQCLLQERPAIVIVYGDTNSTLAGSLAASKLHIPVVHVEAGLRSFNRVMPEEINRIVADHTADWLFAPTPTAMRNLDNEGLSARARNTGDVMYDAVLYNRKLAETRSDIVQRQGLIAKKYGVVTIHRAENTNDEVLPPLLDTLNMIAHEYIPLVFPVHPRTRKGIQEIGDGWRPDPRLTLLEPQGYLDMLQLVSNAAVALTDSGGLQKEAFFLGCPCVTVRGETEWRETVDGGGNTVAGTEPAAIEEAVRKWLDRVGDLRDGFNVAEFFGDGDAARVTADELLTISREL